MKDRDKYNVQIIEEIREYLFKYPSIRFIQALYNMGIIDKQDRFYEESNKTLSRVRIKKEDEELDGDDY
jgi:hypothetical protein